MNSHRLVAQVVFAQPKPMQPLSAKAYRTKKTWLVEVVRFLRFRKRDQHAVIPNLGPTEILGSLLGLAMSKARSLTIVEPPTID